MDSEDSPGLLKSILGIFAQRQPGKAPTSVKSQALDAWVRADAYLQYETNNFDEIEPEQVARTLGTLEKLVQYDSDQEPDSSSRNNLPYPKLQALRRMDRRPNHDAAHAGSGPTFRVSKRKRENDDALKQLLSLDMESKRRRVVPREETNIEDTVGEPEADLAILMRKHSMSLHQGLRRHWTCVCQKCSGLSVRLSLPQWKKTKSSHIETCFEVFFGVRSLLAITLQEAKITVKHNDTTMSTSNLTPNALPEFAHICQSITESLYQRNCLHLLFEDGLFKRLRPQPKTFEDAQIPRTVSLTALFERQGELSGGSSVLPLKGKRILAVTLARALLPFLETPWVQPSFNHSKIQFYQPLQDGELPNITKPFLAMEQAPIISANRTDIKNHQTELASNEHMVHPNASVLALGILLCELHYCRPIESWQNNTEMNRNLNTDYYTSLTLLKYLEDDAGADYYLATKACLNWEYFPTGELTSFESASVQRLFYQNVIKRLETEIFKSWGLSLEDLNSLDSRENEACWGPSGREVVRQQTAKPEPSPRSNEDLTASPPASNMTLQSLNLHNPTQHTHNGHMISPPSLQDRSQRAEYSLESLYFFDASQPTASEQDTELSERWMNNLLSSIYRYVDPFDNTAQPFAGFIENNSGAFKPVRIAILDSGFDPRNPQINDGQRLDPRIKGVQNFVRGTGPLDIQDDIGHGTHALGLLLNVATCAEIYIAKVANQETLGHGSYDAITEAINHAVTEWKADIISMSFGIREYHEPMKNAIKTALHNQTLIFAAASNDGGNYGRAFPARYPSVFCIHATDGNGNPSKFNPTADEKDVNFSLLGEHVRSHWPRGKNGHNDDVHVMSGTSIATPIAAGIAASVLSFVRQQEQGLREGSDFLGPWLKDVHSMDAVLKSMVRQTRGSGYDYITPHLLFEADSSKEHVYNKIKDIKKHMYD